MTTVRRIPLVGLLISALLWGVALTTMVGHPAEARSPGTPSPTGTASSATSAEAAAAALFLPGSRRGPRRS